jgi:TetR/AcrR family transcriptional regulator, repressor of fatR-cypB operon
MAKIIDKQEVILNTALKLLVENGFHNTPMSLIAKEAGVSAGIIYHYFESKDDLIHQLYQEVEAKLAQALQRHNTAQLEGLALLKQLWLNAYNFYVAHPGETLFLEQYKNSPFYKQGAANSIDQKWFALLQKLEQAINEGKIVKLPILVIYTLTLAVAMSLAKQQIAQAIELDEATLEKVAEAVCRSVQPA